MLVGLFLGGNSDSWIWMLVGRLHPAASWSCKPVVVIVGDGDATAALFFGGNSDGSMMVRKLCWSWNPVVVVIGERWRCLKNSLLRVWENS